MARLELPTAINKEQYSWGYPKRNQEVRIKLQLKQLKTDETQHVTTLYSEMNEVA